MKWVTVLLYSSGLSWFFIRGKLYFGLVNQVPSPNLTYRFLGPSRVYQAYAESFPDKQCWRNYAGCTDDPCYDPQSFNQVARPV